TAEATIEESAAEAKRNVASAQSQVDMLTKQRKTITAQLAQLRSLFAMPGVIGSDHVDPAQAECACRASEQIADGQELEDLLAEDGSGEGEQKSEDSSQTDSSQADSSQADSSEEGSAESDSAESKSSQAQDAADSSESEAAQ